MTKRDHIVLDEHSCCWRESMKAPDFFQNLASPDLKKIKTLQPSPCKMHMEDCAVGLTRFLSLAYCQLSFPADLLRAQWFVFNPLPMFLCCTEHLLHGKDKTFPPITVMFTIITSFILKLLFLQMPLSWSTVRVPHCSRADRQLTSPARVHRPAVLMRTQKAPALPASSCWKGISWELSAFREVALFTWTWSLGAKERVIRTICKVVQNVWT